MNKQTECKECGGTGELECQGDSHYIDTMSSHDCFNPTCEKCDGTGKQEQTMKESVSKMIESCRREDGLLGIGKYDNETLQLTKSNMTIYEQYKEDIKPLEKIKIKNDGMEISVMSNIKQSYLNSIDCMIGTLEKAEERAFKLWQESSLALDQSVQFHSRNLGKDLKEQRKLIQDYE